MAYLQKIDDKPANVVYERTPDDEKAEIVNPKLDINWQPKIAYYAWKKRWMQSGLVGGVVFQK